MPLHDTSPGLRLLQLIPMNVYNFESQMEGLPGLDPFSTKSQLGLSTSFTSRHQAWLVNSFLPKNIRHICQLCFPGSSLTYLKLFVNLNIFHTSQFILDFSTSDIILTVSITVMCKYVAFLLMFYQLKT